MVDLSFSIDYFSVVLICLLFSVRHVELSDIPPGNEIRVSEPGKNTVWLPGQNSFPITWTQSMFCFRWNIELLDTEKSRVVEVSTSLSEFKEGAMEYQWLVPSTILPGVYHIKVSDASSPSHFGISESFIVANKDMGVHQAEHDETDAFSPSSSSTPSTQFSSANATADRNLQPHEQRRKKKLTTEKEYFKNINMTKYWPRSDQLCTIDRVHKPSKEEFVNNYMKLHRPAIITGMMEDWKAMKSWNFEKLGGHLTKGVKVDIMEVLTPYARWDEYRHKLASRYREPVKIEMSNFHEVYPDLMQDIKILDFFRNEADFMEVIDKDIRPPHLSFQMAAQRSGFHWRVEPLNASSWSALFVGNKRWGLYPSERYFVPGVVHNNHRVQNSQLSEPFIWWAYAYPNLDADHRPIECVQKPGEILYIPSGWWWSNINLEDSISLQKSFCDTFSIRACLQEMKERADSAEDNYFGDIFVQLRHHLLMHHPEMLTEDDLKFTSPVKGRGKTEEELEGSFNEQLWQKYFMDDSEEE